MNDNTIIPLIEKARQGCQESMNSLIGRVQDDLFSYIYRLTLDENLSNDIRQETLIEMCRSIKDLRSPEAFKSWLYRTAWAKVNNYYRSIKNKRCMSIHDKNNLVDGIQNKEIEGLKSLISKEIAETLVDSLSKLEPKQKNVLVLRCYENLSYSQIAGIMDCSEISARLTFFRAKDKLRSQLRKKGITKASFLMLLCIFGQITSPTKAAVTVSASSLEVGVVAATIGTIVGKICFSLISLIAGVGIIVGGTAMINQASNNDVGPAKQEIKSFHFVKQAWEKSYIPNANLLMGKSLSRGAYEKWYFFPEGVDGPLFQMTQRWDPQVQNKLCGWRLDGDGQFYYHSGRNEIYRFSTPLANKDTLRFPCDSQEFCDFLDAIEGKEAGVDYKRDPETGLLVELYDNRFANAKDFKSAISYNVLDEKTFGDFRYKWPETAPVIDERDEIHRQGWTVFHITGTINGRAVYGNCRIPFVYNKLREYPPVLSLKIGDDLTLVDSAAGAAVLDHQGRVTASYPAGSFFKGLMRPWFGIHTIDSIRRDAAECRIPFKLENINFKEYDYERRIVTLYDAPGYENTQISVSIDIDKNQIDKMEFGRPADDGKIASLGTLEFSYPASAARMAEMTEMPQINTGGLSNTQGVGMFWLFDLADGTLGQ